ncbi:MAG: hypothetical protein ACOC1K_01050 [Nanoarchaeota archaeon]
MTKNNKGLYWALIITFIVLYISVAFVSTLHAITFFQLANTLGLAIFLGAAYEIGQAAVLFSILTTENKNRMLAWGMMFLLTALQVTANVYASFKFMDGSGSQDWTYWQRSILFAVQAESSEMYKVIISWITGALLPIVALGMTSLVADNIKMVRGIKEEKEDEKDTIYKDDVISADKVEEIINNEVKKRLEEKDSLNFVYNKDTEEEIKELSKNEVKEEQSPDKKEDVKTEEIPEVTLKTKTKEIKGGNTLKVNEEKGKIEPFNKERGWHLKKEFIDNEGNVFHKGKYSHTIPIDKDKEEKKYTSPPKKA